MSCSDHTLFSAAYQKHLWSFWGCTGRGRTPACSRHGVRSMVHGEGAEDTSIGPPGVIHVKDHCWESRIEVLGASSSKLICPVQKRQWSTISACRTQHWTGAFCNARTSSIGKVCSLSRPSITAAAWMSASWSVSVSRRVKLAVDRLVADGS